jgi:hypothetical protein
MRPAPLLALLAAIAVLLALPAASSAQTVPVSVGIGDQADEMFANPNFRALRIRKVRYFVRWDAIDQPGALADVDLYVRNARAAGARVLLHISTNDLGRKSARLPTVREFRTKVGPLVRRMRGLGVREFGVWNEANHDTQPTWNNPRRAAQFFLEMRKMARGSTVVALDLLDQRGVERYIRRFYAALGRRNARRATVVGIHNYSDTNRASRRGRGTRSIINTVKRFNRRTKFWLTETGGVVKFGGSFRCNPASPASAERRAARALQNMFTLTRRFRRDINRLYIYNFTGDNCEGRFDAGLMRDRAGTIRRPGYAVVQRELRRFRR